LLKVACSGPGVSRTRNLLVTSPILYQLDHCTHSNGSITTAQLKTLQTSSYFVKRLDSVEMCIHCQQQRRMVRSAILDVHESVHRRTRRSHVVRRPMSCCDPIDVFDCGNRRKAGKCRKTTGYRERMVQRDTSDLSLGSD